MAPGPDQPARRTAPAETGRLAPVYRRALALEAEGAEDAAMARDLDVPVESIPMLLRIAHAKAGSSGDGDAPPPSP
jgi:hypothetical protein